MNEADLQRWEQIVERELLGETASADDAAFRARFEEQHAEVARESAAWAQLIGHLREVAGASGDPVPDLAQRVLIRRDLERGRGRGQVTPLPRRRAVAVAAAAGVLAAAAGVALVIAPGDSSPPREPGPDRAAMRAPTPAAPEATASRSAADTDVPLPPAIRVALAGPGLLVDEGPARAGAELRPGQLLALDGSPSTAGDACIAYESPWIVACIGRGSVLRLGADPGGSTQRVELERGRLLAVLDPLPVGQRFEVVTSRGVVSAVGTAFEVWIDEHGMVTASVLDGEVALGGPSPTTLRAGESARLGADSRDVQPAPEPSTFGRTYQDLSWLWRGGEHGVLVLDGLAAAGKASLTLDARPLGPAPISLLVPPGSHTLARAGDPDATTVEMAAGETRELTLSDAAGPAADRPRAQPSATALVRRASEARASARYREAARLLGQIVELYPDSPEAQNARVEAADLWLEKLGRPERALALYDAYLQRGGPLTPEARYGRARALRPLGRAGEEKAAIELFLARHPSDWRGSELRERLAHLGG